MKQYDVIVIGAGAAGLTAAAVLLRRAKSVLVLDMGAKPARKVSVSGGGNCNITNSAVAVERYFGQNKNFVRGALSRLAPQDVLQWCNIHNINLYEKTPGRYFCVKGASTVVKALLDDVDGADIKYNHLVESVHKNADSFIVQTKFGQFNAESVIVATGGTSFGSLDTSDIGYKIAKNFGHKIVPVRPALCAVATKYFDAQLSGISVSVEITVDGTKIQDDMLFTHFGIGGPAVYRATVRDISYGMTINLCPGIDLFQELKKAKQTNGRRSISNILSLYMPARMAKFFVGNLDKNIADIRDDIISKIVDMIQCCHLDYSDITLHSMKSAEIVRGGVSTEQISSKTMESKLCSGLFFAGEVLDIAGDLGGFNLHWAWASGYVAGKNA